MPRRLAVLTRPNFSTYQRVQWRALAYGAALNEGRKLFNPDDDKGFGQWKHGILLSQLGIVAPKADEDVAAMWAAANPDQFSEARAKRRLADEYDAAQERGEVATRADQNLLPNEKKVSVADIGLTHKDIHEARLIRDAEEADPGVVRRSRRTTRFGNVWRFLATRSPYGGFFALVMGDFSYYFCSYVASRTNHF